MIKENDRIETELRKVKINLKNKKNSERLNISISTWTYNFKIFS